MEILQAASLYHWHCFYNLYRKAFPKEERKPVWMIRRMQKQGKSHVWCFVENGRFAGLASTVNGDGKILLDYLAVVKDSRGKGYGTRMLKLLQEQYRDTGFFGEIEIVRPQVEDYEMKCRRKQFYLDNGLTALKVGVMLFGVEMELMSYNCTLTYDEYVDFYGKNLGTFALDHISQVEWWEK